MEQQIRLLIQKGKSKEALDLMTPYADEAIMLRGRLSSLERNNNMGMIDFSDYSREINRINFSILSLLDSDDLQLPKQAPEQTPTNNTTNAERATPKTATNRPPKVFVSYAHDDTAMLRDMEAMLKILERKGDIDIWTDKEILPGQNWSQDINDKLLNADIIFLMLSASFLNSDYIWRNEMQLALKNGRDGKAVVIPIILRPCLWKEVEGLSQLQALPMTDEGRLQPITKWADKDEAWVKVAEGVKKVIENRKIKAQ
jgi:hypothetical protein